MNSNKTVKLRKFFTYYKPYKALLIGDLLSALITAALALVLPLCVRYVVNDVLEFGTAEVLPEILRMGALMLLIISAQTVFALFYDYKGHDMGARIERDMRQELFEHYQKLPISFYDNQKTGQLMSRLTSDLLNLAELCHHGPENIVVYGTQFIGALVILFNINWKLTLVACVFLPVLAVYTYVFYHKLQRVYSESRQRIADVNAMTEDNISGVRVVKSFTGENIENKKFKVENNKFYMSKSSIYKHQALHFTVTEVFFVQLITVAIVVAGGIWISKGTLDLANLLVFIMYAVYLTGPVPKLAFMVEQFQEGFSGYRRFREIMDIEPDIRDKENAAELSITDGRVTFDNVTFRYNEGLEYVLQNINLDVAGGETVAIVGRSGIGKTTICSLIPRFYEVGGGAVRIDGVDIRDVSVKSLREQIGVVQQDTFLFAGTVLENILYGKPGATAEEVVEAAKKANAHEFIMEFPNGYNTDIGQRGAKLSGGQQQRISIARVFLKNPPILIFDEATSALDYESEKSVMDSLRTLVKGRTTFIIAHRLSTVRNADRIVVLTDQGIAEQGTHEQLYAMDGVYAKLYNTQAKQVI